MSKKELSKSLEVAVQSRDAIQNGIATIEQKLKDLKNKAYSELAATGETELSGEISSTESYLQLRRSALEQANEAVRAAQFELDDFIKAERYTEAVNLHKEFRAMMNQLEKQLGDAGVNGMINQVFDIMNQIHAIVGTEGNSDIVLDLRRSNFILVSANQHLFKAWQDMRSLPWVGERSSGGDSAHYKAGFGRTYS
jgi:hypothetical protein